MEEQVLVTASGISTHCHMGGRGNPVVLLHGSGPGVSAWANWSGVAPRLAGRYRVIAPDMAGFGKSRSPDGGPNIKVWVRQLIELLDALDIERASVIGNSFGGGLALAAVLRHPERFDRLILMGTPAGTFPQPEGLKAGMNFVLTLESMEQALKRLAYDPAIVTPEMVRARYAAALEQDGVEAFRRLMPPPPPEGETAMVRGVPEESLRTIKHETLVLHGREDRVVPPECGLLLNRCIPHSQLHLFGCCGHWVHLEQETRFMQLVEAFLAEAAKP